MADASAGTISATLSLVDEMSQPLDAAASKASSAGGAIEGAATKTSSAWQAVGTVVAGASAALVGTISTVGAEWEGATRTIVEGTGATGAALAGLQDVYGDLRGSVRASADEIASAVADLNTHTGLTGDALQALAAQALQAGVDTNTFGSAVRQAGLDAEGAGALLDQLVVVSQNTGVSVDQLTQAVGRNSARFQTAGVDVETLTAYVAQAATEFGPAGLRGAMSELAQQVDSGTIPAVQSLQEQLGDTQGATERTYEATLTFGDQIGILTGKLVGMVGPGSAAFAWAGDAVGQLATMGPAITPLLLAFPSLGKAAGAAWTAITGPIGIITAAIAGLGVVVWTFRDDLADALASALATVADWVTSALALLHRWASVADEALGTSFADRLVDAASAVSQFSVDAQTALRDYATEVRGGREATDELTGALGAGGAGAASGGGGGGSTLTAGLQSATAAAQPFIETIRAIPTYVGQSINSIGSLGALGGNFLRGAGPLGTQWGEAFSAGFLRGVEPLAGTIPQIVGGGAGTAGIAWGDTGFQSSQSWLGGFTRQLFGGGGGGGGGFLGALGKGLGLIQGGWQGIAKKALNLVPVVGPILSAFSGPLLKGLGAIGKKIGGWVKGLFGGPSGAELAARETFHAWAAETKAVLGESEEYQREVQRAVADGWDTSLAEARASFILLGQQAGLTYDQSFELYGQYQKALQDGDTKRQAEIEAMLRDDLEAWQANREGRVEVAAEAEERIRAEQERTTRSALSSYERAKDAGERAYQETYEAAIEAGATEEEASNRATAARERNIRKILNEERKSFVRQAAMQAALALGADATAEEREQAARRAARGARESWEVALRVIEESDEATTQTMERRAGRRSTAQADASEEAAASAEESAERRSEADAGAAASATQAAERSREAYTEAAGRTAEEWRAAVEDIIAQQGRIPAGGEVPGAPGGIAWGGSFAAGGSGIVSRPTAFLAGEAGPERYSFTPLGSGGSGGGGGTVVVQLRLDGAAQEVLAEQMVRLEPRVLDRVGARRD